MSRRFLIDFRAATDGYEICFVLLPILSGNSSDTVSYCAAVLSVSWSSDPYSLPSCSSTMFPESLVQVVMELGTA